MASGRRVVITGLGAVTPLGPDVPALWHGLCSGESGIGHITRFDASDLPVQIAGEIKDFDPCQRLPPKLVKRTSRFIQYALWSSLEAVTDAGLDGCGVAKDRVGVVIGSGLGGLEVIVREHEKALRNKGPHVSPLLLPTMLPDMAAGQVSIYFGYLGPNYCTSSACCSGAHAIGSAFRHIVQGEAEAMLAGGSEAGITHFLISGLTRMNALSRRNDEPKRASRPFDADRDGFVIAEGAGIMVLEALDHAKKRDAKIYAELAGYGYSGDAYHITAPHPEGEGASIAMREALNSSGLPVEAIGYINAHGTSTRVNDIIETRSIRRVFREWADRIPVSATKSMTGHLQAACGAVECIVSTLSVYHQRVHPTLNLDTPDPECDLDYVPEGPRDLKIEAALSNSFGFGGHNVSLVIKKYPD